MWERGQQDLRAREGGPPGMGGTNYGLSRGPCPWRDSCCGGKVGGRKAGGWVSSGSGEIQRCQCTWAQPRTHPESRVMWPRSVLQRLRMRMGVPRELMPTATRDDTFTSAASCRRPPRVLREGMLGVLPGL